MQQLRNLRNSSAVFGQCDRHADTVHTQEHNWNTFVAYRCDIDIDDTLIKLPTFAASYSWYTAWLASDIKNNRSLNPWYQKMCAFTNSLLLHSTESVKDYRSVTTVNCKQQIQQYISHHKCSRTAQYTQLLLRCFLSLQLSISNVALF